MNPDEVTALMVVIYAVFLCLLLGKFQTNKKIVMLIAIIGLIFGFLSHVTIGILSIFELQLNHTGFVQFLLIAPLQEEIMKFLFFILGFVAINRITQTWHQTFQEPSPTSDIWKGIVLGALIGLFFATFENLIDYTSQNVFFTLLRTISTWPIHMIATSISAYGFSKYRANNQFVFFVALAVVIHVLFNLVVLR